MIDYYDTLLVGIAAVMLAGGAATAHPAVAVYQGLGTASIVATLILVEMLFRNPPTEPDLANAAASGIVGVGWLLTVVFYL